LREKEKGSTMALEQISLFGINIHVARMDDAVAEVYSWINSDQDGCRYVVTPNVDHAVMFQHHANMQRAYASAGLVLADGQPVVIASRCLKKPLPERVTGADLTPAIFAAAKQNLNQPLRVFLLGAAEGVAAKAAENITADFAEVEVVGVYSPPMGFERDEDENERILAMISDAEPHVLVVGLGAPKQEIWVHRHQARLNCRVALCVGATIDFLAGAVPRAPQWMQKRGLEWFYRMCSDPGRLVKRYAWDAWVLPQLFWREWWYGGTQLVEATPAKGLNKPAPRELEETALPEPKMVGPKH